MSGKSSHEMYAFKGAKIDQKIVRILRYVDWERTGYCKCMTG